MTRSRLTALAAMFLLLGGCATAYPPGIIDVFVPPQAKPVTSQQTDPAFCRELVRTPSEEPLRTEDLVPCTSHIIAAITDPTGDAPIPRDRKGVTPPAKGRR